MAINLVSEVLAIVFAVADPAVMNAQSISALEFIILATLLGSWINRWKTVVIFQKKKKSELWSWNIYVRNCPYTEFYRWNGPSRTDREALTTSRFVRVISAIVVPVAEPMLGDAFICVRALYVPFPVTTAVIHIKIVPASNLILAALAVHLRKRKSNLSLFNKNRERKNTRERTANIRKGSRRIFLAGFPQQAVWRSEWLKLLEWRKTIL